MVVLVASPAHAGMYPVPAPAGPGGIRFPRTRGDVPMPRKPKPPRGGLPPHTRGCTLGRPRARAHTRASPAHAGMYPLSDRYTGRHCGFPRTRGDVPEIGDGGRDCRTLPPHTRGCTQAPQPRTKPNRASPAHAGMYPAPRRHSRRAPRFPRTRGDVPMGEQIVEWMRALPPHTRGCTVDRIIQGRPG